MDLKNLHRELETLHAQGDSAGILKRVDRDLAELKLLPPSPWIGSIYRYAMLACYRLREYQNGDAWWDRAMEQFTCTGYLKGVAYMLVTPAFRSLDLVPDHRAMESVALMVIQAVKAIAQFVGDLNGKEDEIIADSTFRRVCDEKRAYCLFRIGRYQEAVAAYGTALEHVCVGDPKQTNAQLREELKVRGGAAIANYFSGIEVAREAAIRDLKEIERRSLNIDHLTEIHRVTVKNLELLQSEGNVDPNRLLHYDIR